jgi:hypothetical protein
MVVELEGNWIEEAMEKIPFWRVKRDGDGEEKSSRQWDLELLFMSSTDGGLVVSCEQRQIVKYKRRKD